MTYDELVTNIRNYTDVDANVFSNAVINTFITMAENQILREIDLDVFKLEVAGNMTSGNKFLAAPSDILTHRYLMITDGSDQIFLDFRYEGVLGGRGFHGNPEILFRVGPEHVLCCSDPFAKLQRGAGLHLSSCSVVSGYSDNLD